MNALRSDCLCQKVLIITRKVLGMTLEHVAKKSGYCISTVRRFEYNPDSVSYNVRNAIIEVYEKAGATVLVEKGRIVVSAPYNSIGD